MTYSLNPNNILTPEFPVAHRDEEYHSAGFEVLRDMQSRHFWYQGRHRFVLRALKGHLARPQSQEQGLTAIDLGGGCGGWVSYLQERMPGVFTELALSDSSLRALEWAGPVVGTAYRGTKWTCCSWVGRTGGTSRFSWTYWNTSLTMPKCCGKSTLL